jgi:hypothetical protein
MNIKSFSIPKLKERNKQIILIILGAITLLVDAFYNGYPIVYSDTHTYINCGMGLLTPGDRSLTYGFFLKFMSYNGLSLWLVIFFQAIIISFLIFTLIRQLFKHNGYLLFIISIILLSFLTSLSFLVCSIMPDIFTSIALLSVAIILIGNLPKNTLCFIYFIFLLSCGMHISHLMMYCVILFILLIFKKYIFNKQLFPGRTRKIITMLILLIISVFTMGHALSNSKHVFLFGAMVEHGIIKQYLEDNCETKHYKMCAYKDSLPKKAWEFVWSGDSPLYKIGGWDDGKSEMLEIINNTLTKPKYIWMNILASIDATFEQLSLFKAMDGYGEFIGEDNLVYMEVKNNFNSEIKQYSNSKQNQGKIDSIEVWNNIFNGIIFISIFIIIILFIICRYLFSAPIKSLIILFMIGILVNAWDCGTFANAIDRLGCRMIWLIPLLGLIVVFNYYNSNNKTLETN